MISAIGSRSTAARAGIVGLLAIAVATVFVVGIAWACTPQAYVAGLSATSGPAGSPVTVTGRSFMPNRAVRVSVGSQSVATAPTNNSGDFTVQITIPPGTPAGTTTIVVVPLGSTPYSASSAFTVTAPADAVAPPQEPVAQPPAEPAPAPVAAAEPAAQPAPAAPVASKQPAAAQPQAGATRPQRPVGTAKPAVRQQPARPAAAAQRAPGAPQASTAGAPSEKTSAPRPARSDSAARTGDSGQTQRSFDSRPGAAAPSGATATADAWSGFSTGERPSLSASAPPPTAGSPTEMTVGLGILGVGLLTLLGGFAVTELRRRRAVSDRRQ